jgi:hypothetical protein
VRNWVSKFAFEFNLYGYSMEDVVIARLHPEQWSMLGERLTQLEVGLLTICP